MPLPHVEPGELITAADFNALSDAIGDLQETVDGFVAPSGHPNITTVSGPGGRPLIAGREMVIVGQNFNVAVFVRFGTVEVRDFLQPPTATLLRLTIPRTVTGATPLSVHVGTLSDSTEVTIQPPVDAPVGRPRLFPVLENNQWSVLISGEELEAEDEFQLIPRFSRTPSGSSEASLRRGARVKGRLSHRITLAPSGTQSEVRVPFSFPAGTDIWTALQARSTSNHPDASRVSCVFGDSASAALRIRPLQPIDPDIRLVDDGESLRVEVPVGRKDLALPINVQYGFSTQTYMTYEAVVLYNVHNRWTLPGGFIGVQGVKAGDDWDYLIGLECGGTGPTGEPALLRLRIEGSETGGAGSSVQHRTHFAIPIFGV